MSTAELSRRRAILIQYIGTECELKPKAVKRKYRFLLRARGTITEVNRTRATIDFHEFGEFTCPIGGIWLPPSPQPAPNQRELFA